MVYTNRATEDHTHLPEQVERFEHAMHPEFAHGLLAGEYKLWSGRNRGADSFQMRYINRELTVADVPELLRSKRCLDFLFAFVDDPDHVGYETTYES